MGETERRPLLSERGQNMYPATWNPSPAHGWINGDSKIWAQLNSKRRLNTRQTVGCGISSSLLALRVDLRGLRSKLSWIHLTFSSDTRGRDGAFAFIQKSYLLKLVIPTTNALPRWRWNVETKTKRKLHSSRRLSFNEFTTTKNLALHSSHFALNWRCCTAVRLVSVLAFWRW